MKNYLTYPMSVMNITQTYNGNTSHKPHTTGNIKDYPVDDGGKDSGRDYVLCPCDKMKVVRIYGVGNSGTNTVWLTSTEKVFFADGTSDYVTVMFVHPGDDDLKKIKVGQTFVRNEKMFREGKDGATANHIHIAVGKGKIKGNGWAQNSNKKWVLTTTGGTVKPEKAFYLDKNVTTTIKKNGGLTFINMPIEVAKVTFKIGDKVKVKAGATAYDGTKLASFVYSTTFTVMSVKDDRVVIGLNGKVTAAIKATNLTKVVVK